MQIRISEKNNCRKNNKVLVCSIYKECLTTQRKNLTPTMKTGNGHHPILHKQDKKIFFSGQ